MNRWKIESLLILIGSAAATMLIASFNEWSTSLLIAGLLVDISAAIFCYLGCNSKRKGWIIGFTGTAVLIGILTRAFGVTDSFVYWTIGIETFLLDIALLLMIRLSSAIRHKRQSSKP